MEFREGVPPSPLGGLGPQPAVHHRGDVVALLCDMPFGGNTPVQQTVGVERGGEARPSKEKEGD